MNLYFLVEGRRTERKVYPAWLSYLLPNFSRVDRFDAVTVKNYYLISGEGYPSLLTHLGNAIEDFNKIDRFSHPVLCLDADEASPIERVSEIEQQLAKQRRTLSHGELRIVIQNRTIETWFLGNPKVLTRQPQSAELRKYIEFHDVSQLDPERMSVLPGFSTHAQFHVEYLKEMLREKRLTYSKRQPGPVMEQSYLDQLVARTKREPTHLKSFQGFLEFCEYTGSVTGLARN